MTEFKFEFKFCGKTLEVEVIYDIEHKSFFGKIMGLGLIEFPIGPEDMFPDGPDKLDVSSSFFFYMNDMADAMLKKPKKNKKHKKNKHVTSLPNNVIQFPEPVPPSPDVA